jgi:hypothetical protein
MHNNFVDGGKEEGKNASSDGMMVFMHTPCFLSGHTWGVACMYGYHPMGRRLYSASCNGVDMVKGDFQAIAAIHHRRGRLLLEPNQDLCSKR